MEQFSLTSGRPFFFVNHTESKLPGLWKTRAGHLQYLSCPCCRPSSRSRRHMRSSCGRRLNHARLFLVNSFNGVSLSLAASSSYLSKLLQLSQVVFFSVRLSPSRAPARLRTLSWNAPTGNACRASLVESVRCLYWTSLRRHSSCVTSQSMGSSCESW